MGGGGGEREGRGEEGRERRKEQRGGGGGRGVNCIILISTLHGVCQHKYWQSLATPYSCMISLSSDFVINSPRTHDGNIVIVPLMMLSCTLALFKHVVLKGAHLRTANWTMKMTLQPSFDDDRFAKINWVGRESWCAIVNYHS